MNNTKPLNRFFVFLLLSITIFSCNSENTRTENKEQINKEQATQAIQQEIDTTQQANIDLTEGAKIYKEKCMVCHQEDGKGIEGTFPPLANSDYLLADKERAIIQTIAGSKNPITVNGIEYQGNTMTTAPDLSNKEIAAVVNYVLNSWGNNGGFVTPEEVKEARKKITD